MSNRRKSLETVWTTLVLGWSGLRILFAETYMVKYGINIWIFILVEVLSSPILALSSTRLVRVLVVHDLRRIGFWGAVALASYAAPDVYLLTAGRGVPWRLYGVIGFVMTVAGIVSIVRMRRSVREAAVEVSPVFDNL